MLRQGYIELLAIVDPTLPDNQLGAFLQRYEGIHIIAFAVDDAGANVARLRAAGLTQAAISPLQRMAATPDGERLAAFARIPLPPGEAPEGRIQLIQHLTPDVHVAAPFCWTIPTAWWRWPIRSCASRIRMSRRGASRG